MLSYLPKEEKIREDDFRESSETEKDVHFCEPKKGLFLGEDDDGNVEVRPVESLMNYQEGSNHHVEMMLEASKDTMRSYIFETNDLCVFIGCASKEVGQSFKTVIKVDKGGDMLSKGMES
jgi:hypothetical protein